MGQILEKFSEPVQKLHRPPLCCGGGNQALSNAERIDGYVSACASSDLNSKARIFSNYNAVSTMEDHPVPQEDPESQWPNGQVVWMDATADGGLPHTRPPHYIMIPHTMDLTSPQGRITLTHERIHISQRIHGDSWSKILKSAWDFDTVSAPNLPPQIRSRLRINPDTFRAPIYAWKGAWIPYALYESSFSPKLNSVKISWWHIPSCNLYSVAPPGWMDFFGGNLSPSSHEHPYELAAYLLTSSVNSPARIALEKSFGDLSKDEPA